MKASLKYYFAIMIAGLYLSGCVSAGYVTQAPVYQEPYQQEEQVTYQSFYDNLSPYGNWIDYPQYGHVWNPRVSAGFRPYATNGQWRYSNDGWAWQSNYNWGWAPFHYGRWLLDDNYGWLWVPGYDWSPAWVTWGQQENNYAWAPLMPEVNVGVQYNNWRPHASYWNIVPRERVGDRNISTIIVHYDHDNNNVINSNNTNIYNNTTIINNNNTKNITIINNYNTSRTNNYYSKGPEVAEVERYTHTKIQPVVFRDVHQINKSNNNSSNVMEVYRPVVQNPQRTQVVQPAGNNQINGGHNYPANNPVSNQNNSRPGEANTIERKYKKRDDNNKPANNGLSTPMPIQNIAPSLDKTSTGAGNLPVAFDENSHRINNNSQPLINRPSVQNNIPVEGTMQAGRVQQLTNTNQNPGQQQLLRQQQAIQLQQQQTHQQQQQQEKAQQQQIQRSQVQQQRQNQQQQQQYQNRNDVAPIQQQGNQNIDQPRVFRRVEPNQTRPIRNEAQTPVMQERQQQQNVQRLPVQKATDNNSNNRIDRNPEKQ